MAPEHETPPTNKEVPSVPPHRASFEKASDFSCLRNIEELASSTPPEKQEFFLMSAPEMGLAFDHCSGQGKGKVVPE